MGKPEDDEFSLSTVAAGEGSSGSNVERRIDFRLSRFIGIKCLLTLLLGLAVFLSAIFWLPPFSKLADQGETDLDPRYRGHTIVASFKLLKLVSFLKDNVAQLEADIYDELQAANTKVVILSLESSPGSNVTNVVFGVDPESKWSSISPFGLSVIRSSFQYLASRQINLRLTTSLFGSPSFFEVLKFPGGITVTPLQDVFPLQNVQIRFNFTLNNSILQVQQNFEDLKEQLTSGLHLTQNENLYIRLTNSRGSTVAPPATVETYVVLAVGIPSVPRLKQLAQTIRDSPARNLGLNNTVFGKVKQVSLSSILQHSLNGDAGGPAPAPAPTPHPHHHHHHCHHRHYHQHHQDQGTYLPPAYAPSYSPAEAPPQPVEGSPTSRGASPPSGPVPVGSYQASPSRAPAPIKSYHANPPGCSFGFGHRHAGKSPEPSPSGAAVTPTMPHPRFASSPRPQAKSPTPVVHRISPSSPLPYVVYARVHPPSVRETNPAPPKEMPLIAPSRSAGGHIQAAHWVLSLLLALLLHRW